jgi:hypothetical protein
MIKMQAVRPDGMGFGPLAVPLPDRNDQQRGRAKPRRS